MDKYVPQKPMRFPLGKEGTLVSQRDLYLAMTDFDSRRKIGEATDPFLAAAQTIRDALGSDDLSCLDSSTS